MASNVTLRALLRNESRMATSPADQSSDSIFSLTRMIYTVGCSVAVYEAVAIIGWLWLTRAQRFPGGSFDLWFHATNLAFVVAMVAVAVPYSPKSEIFRWSTLGRPAGIVKSIAWGTVGGAGAFVLASPLFLWLHDRQLEFVRRLIARALTPLGVLDLAFFVISMAAASEAVFRGVVLRTLAGYASLAAALFGSCLLFAYAYPLFSFPTAMILGLASALVYYKTRNLIARFLRALFSQSPAALSLCIAI
jgi:membrane protease YdiL (CAAX protease family)